MAVRQDKAQLIVEIKAAESAEYQKLLKRQKELVSDTRKLEKGSAAYNDKLADTIQLTREFSKIDINKVSLRQIEARSRELNKLKKILPQNSQALRDLEVEQKKLNNAMAQARQRTKGVSKGLTDAQGSGSKFLGFIKTAIPLITAFFAVGKMIEWGRSLLDLGTEIDVFDRKFKTVFGESTDIVTAFAEENARTMGLTRNEYETAATAVGDLLVPIGFQRDQAALLSAELLNNAGAVSEWTAGQKTAKDVSEIYTKAILGEREQLKTLGISINEADVKARLAAKGQEKLTGNYLKQAKALATYELILEKSKDAQTAFSENSDTLLRKRNELRSELQENIEQLSKELLPIWNRVVKFGLSVANTVVQIVLAAKSLPQFIAENKDQFVLLGVALLSFNTNLIISRASLLLQRAAILKATIAQKAHLFSWRALNLVIKANPLGFIIGILATLTAAVITAYKRSEKFRGVLFGIGEVAKEVFAIVKEAIGGFVDGFSDIFNGDFKSGFSKIGKAITKSNPIGIALSEGGRLKDAFSRGFNDGKEDFQLEQEAKKQATADADSDTGGGDKPDVKLEVNGVDDGDGDDAEQKKREQDFKLALADQKSFFDRLNLLDEIERQKAIERAQGNADVLAAIERSQEQKELDQKALHYQSLIDIYGQYGEGQSNKVLELQAKLAELENVQAALDKEELAVTNQGILDGLDSQFEAENEKLREKFADALISEQEYEDLKLQQEIENINRRLEILAQLGLAETDQFKSLEKSRTDFEVEQTKIRIESAKNEALAKAAIQKDIKARGKAALDSAISFFKTENQERKKNFGITKALQIAKVGINLQQELSNIFTNFSTIPFIGQILAAIQAGFAIARATQSVAKIKSASFYRGGQVPYDNLLSGQRINHAPNVQTQPGGDNILAYVRSGEVVLNDEQQAQLGGAPTFRSIGVPGFMTGGLTTVNTTPSRNPDLQFGQQASVVDLSPIQDILGELTVAVNELRRQPLRASVNYIEIEEAGDELDEIRGLASI